MFRAILTEGQQDILGLLSRIGEVRTFYLAGGTGLALHLGHRRSRDFDFSFRTVRPPLTPVSAAEREAIRRALGAADLSR